MFSVETVYNGTYCPFGVRVAPPCTVRVFPSRNITLLATAFKNSGPLPHAQVHKPWIFLKPDVVEKLYDYCPEGRSTDPRRGGSNLW